MLGNRPNCMRSMRVSLKEGCAQFSQLYFLACYHGFGWNSCEVISCLQRSTLLGFEMQLQRISSWLWLCHCLDDSVVHVNPGLDENSEVTPWLGLEHPPVIVLGVNSYSYLVWIWGICFQCLYLKECCPAWIRSSLSSLAVESSQTYYHGLRFCLVAMHSIEIVDACVLSWM